MHLPSVAYVGARLVWGTYNSVVLIKLLFGANSDPNVGFLRYQYTFINIGLNLLNLFWFRAMVLALKKRFARSISITSAPFADWYSLTTDL